VRDAAAPDVAAGDEPAARPDLLDVLALGREDGTALGLLRVAVVAVLAAAWWSHLPALDEHFTAASPLAGRFARVAFPSRWSPLFTWDEPTWVWSGFIAVGLAHLLWCAGAWTRLVSAVAVLGWIALLGRQPLLYALPDQLLMALAILLALAPAGRAVAIDAWRRRDGGDGAARLVPVWARHLVQLQLAVMYLATGLLKTGPTWWSEGSALYYALANPFNRHFPIAPWFAASQPWLLRPATWGVLLFELGFVGFVALHGLRRWAIERRWARHVPDLRPLVLGFGVAMHLGIQALMFVAWFTPLVLAAYLAFVAPSEARTWLARLQRRAREPARPLC
jgi:hypothetical protein